MVSLKGSFSRPHVERAEHAEVVEQGELSDTDKASIKHNEEIVVVDPDGVDRHLAVKYPESLVNLSEEELAAVDRKATRKVDILLMPTLMALYVLNYLVSARGMEGEMDGSERRAPG